MPISVLVVGGTGGPGGPSTDYIVDSFNVDNDGDDNFTLSNTPSSVNESSAFVNGVRQVYGDDYSISGTSFSWVSSFTLQEDDSLIVCYFIDA